MVKQIYKQKEIDKLMEDGFSGMVSLPPDGIEEWIKNGNFAHIKKELQQYQDVHFACLKNKKGCTYLFFFKSGDQHYKFAKLMEKLIEGEKIRLANIKSIEATHSSGCLPAGEVSCCPLF